MQRFARSIGNLRKAGAFTSVQRSSVRSFSSGDPENLTIKTNMEQMSGIRWQELEAKRQGMVRL